MNPIIIIEIQSIINIFTLGALLLIIICCISYLKINKKQRQKVKRLDELIKQIEESNLVNKKINTN